MQGSIVITTIFPPRPDVYALAKVKNWQLVAVGDKKTPKDWQVQNTIYLSPDNHKKLFPKFSEILPWNIYGRKNIGHLFSIKEKFPIIGETDDDVTPYPNFPPDVSKKRKATLLSGRKFINIYSYFGGGSSWPRGFPLDAVKDQSPAKEKETTVYAPIQNSVIDKDSDFDAIYRLLSDKPVKFARKGAFALKKGSYCPVNSQNTFFHPEAYPLLYIPCYVNPRVEDILRGYIAQRIIWELGGTLLFSYTTTYTSDRNAHNYLKDFEHELPLYLHIHKIVEILDSLSLSKDVGRSLIKVYTALRKAEIVKAEEVQLVKAWVKEVEKYS